jgi:energy-coupling factor transporter ATP-binding protein EcfA2
MADELSRQAVERTLERLVDTLKTPRALQLRADDLAVLEQAVARVRTQVLGTPEPVLTVALAGGTGAGKSTLINALAGAVVAETSPLRPTTTKLCVYHHRDVAADSLPMECATEAVFIPHEHAALRSKIIVDTPDLDSFATQHRAATRTLLKAAGLVLYVFSPQNYRDERTWSVLREEKRFSACAVVLNKIDLVTPEELEAITDDLRRVFARLELPDIRIFRTVATGQVPREHEAGPPVCAGADDLGALRDYLERELQCSEISRLLNRQRGRVIAHLQAEIDRVAPPRLLEQLDTAMTAVSEHIEPAAARLYGTLATPLALVQADLIPLATLRQHERFKGPFRTWLAVTDVLRFGLPRLARRFLGGVSEGEAPRVEPFLTASQATAAADLLRDVAQELQSLLYTRGLPIGYWRTITSQADGHQLIADITATLETRVEVATVTAASRGRAVVWMVNTLGRLVPAAFVLIGLYVMGRDLLAGDYLGLALFGHLFAMLILTFLALHGIASLFLPFERQWLSSEIGHQVISEVLTRTMTGWISTYRSALEADLTNLYAPLEALQSALAASPTTDEPTLRRALPF